MSNFPGSLLILNGKSAGDDMLREAIHLLRSEGMDIQVRVTWEKGDAERYVAEAIALGVETVIAGGGDGTINEVASALVHRERPHTRTGDSAFRHRERLCHQRGHPGDSG
jgi:diacylglycerol kinase family enzyme